MRFIRKIIAAAVIVFVAAACSTESRQGVASQDEEEPNGVGAASDKKSEDASSPQPDSVTGSNSDDKTDTQGKHDADFVLAAADGGLLEVRLGELAGKQASSDSIKSFAKTMTIDHGKANGELKDLAKKLNISIPDGLSEKSQQKFDELARVNGPAFDRAYAEMMVTDHQETVEKFRVEASNGQQQELRDWAGAKIPNLEHHLMMAKKINDSKRTSASQ